MSATLDQQNQEIVKKSITPYGRLVFGMVLGQFGMTLGTVIPLALLLTLKFLAIDPQHVTADFSVSTAIGGILQLIANYVGGFMSDRTTLAFGKRRTWMLIGGLFGSACLVGIGSAGRVETVVAFYALSVIFFAFVSSSVSALIPDQVEESKRGTASGIIGVFNPAAILLGMALMNIVNGASIMTKFAFIAIISTLTIVTSCALIRDSKGTRRSATHGHAVSWSRIYPNPRQFPSFTWGVLTRFFASVAFASQSFISLYLIQKFHIATSHVTGLMTAMMLIQTICLALSSILGGAMSDKVRRQKPFVFTSAVIMAVGVGIMAFASSLLEAFLGFAVVGLGYGAYLAVDIALIARILPNPADRAKDFGIMNIASSLPNSIVPTIAPSLIAVGGFPLFFSVLGIAGLISAIVVKPIPEMPRYAVALNLDGFTHSE
ncbi:MFS transporter [Alicyclobacillus vulcanalis]|uniref:MFS-type transporter involved in bile tolerance, Atg22 family n=1 Tax=Alicyclobacillus vulcanalis TaxID=252246 RepID=A0A1N7NXH9_9BACL|nr:MFS transporter [Alicyclobacillus vulcanalis]SIT02986.1 MFS-type transporter involved in bile tolerance, Atg22 family [Alicyclobacillus vulcanalis]